ncbi:MAG TPA: thymidine phosphorylase [Acidimicrobiia bacterium]
MNAVELIERKRDGGALTTDEIAWLISEYTADRIPDYQMSAMLMAVFLKGLDQDELGAWTAVMLHSGEVLDFSDVGAPVIDKHSTGGVGDKVSIPLAPMVAACGVAIPMLSGRGLGHTGGTLDKLETIPGFRTDLDPTEFGRLLRRHGLVLAGASEGIAPADRRIYALRDATGTVPSIPLIASSIMSKKLAEGIDGLVLDVKVGRGAFKRELDDARTLARTMVNIGTAYGITAVAFITDMNQPLGREVGNASEVVESIAVLKGGGPADLVEIVFLLGAEMLVLGGVAANAEVARDRLAAAVSSGAALEKFVEVIGAQGGDPRVVEDTSLFPAAAGEHVITAPRAGVVTRCDALDLGVAAMRLGAGRATKEDAIDPGVGITVEAKVGVQVEAGDALARLHFDDAGRLAEATALAERAFEIGDGPAKSPLLLYEEVR